MRHTAALSAKDRRANGDGKPPPVAAGFTVSATLLMALATIPDSGTVRLAPPAGVAGGATRPIELPPWCGRPALAAIAPGRSFHSPWATEYASLPGQSIAASPL